MIVIGCNKSVYLPDTGLRLFIKNEEVESILNIEKQFSPVEILDTSYLQKHGIQNLFQIVSKEYKSKNASTLTKEYKCCRNSDKIIQFSFRWIGTNVELEIDIDSFPTDESEEFYNRILDEMIEVLGEPLEDSGYNMFGSYINSINRGVKWKTENYYYELSSVSNFRNRFYSGSNIYLNVYLNDYKRIMLEREELFDYCKKKK